MIRKKCSGEIKNLYSVIRNNDEFDIIGIVYAVITKESDFCKPDDGCYTHKEVFYVYNRIKEIYGEEIKFQLLRFLDNLKNKYFISYEKYCEQNKTIFENNLIIEKEQNKMPFVKNNFNSQFIIEEMIIFCEKEKRER